MVHFYPSFIHTSQQVYFIKDFLTWRGRKSKHGLKNIQYKTQQCPFLAAIKCHSGSTVNLEESHGISQSQVFTSLVSFTCLNVSRDQSSLENPGERK